MKREAAKAQPSSLSPSFKEHVGEWRKEDFRGPSGKCRGKGGGSQSRMAVAFLAGPKPAIGKRRSGVKKRARDAVHNVLSAEEMLAACLEQAKRNVLTAAGYNTVAQAAMSETQRATAMTQQAKRNVLTAAGYNTAAQAAMSETQRAAAT